MSLQAREARTRRRERIAVSTMSLLIVLVLLAMFLITRCSQKPIGKLAAISTSDVRIVVNESPTPEATAAGAAPPAATPTSARPAAGRPGIVAEVLGAGEGPTATTSGRPGTESGEGQASGPSGGATPGSTSPAAATATSAAAATATAEAVATTAPGAPTSTPRAGATSVPGGGGGTSGLLKIDGLVAPGAYTNGGITVSNKGSGTFNYSVSLTTAGDASFAAGLRLRIYLRVGASCDYPGQPPSPSGDFLTLAGDQTGTTLYDGNFSTGNKVGDPSVELAPGDRVLNAGQSEVLCMELFFPWPAGNQFQGLSVDATFTFTAKSPQ